MYQIYHTTKFFDAWLHWVISNVTGGSEARAYVCTQWSATIQNPVDDPRNLCWNHQDSGIRIVDSNIIFINFNN